MNLGGGGCSKPRMCHCTLAWETESDKRKREGGKERKTDRERKEKEEQGQKARGKEGGRKEVLNRCPLEARQPVGPTRVNSTLLWSLLLLCETEAVAIEATMWLPFDFS